jgi:hypothetical protein
MAWKLGALKIIDINVLYLTLQTYKNLIMKKTLLCLMLVAFGTFNASAQSCTPGVNFQD